MITITGVNKKLDHAEINRYLHGRVGPVAREIERRAVRVLIAAKFQVGVDTGRLKRSLHIEMRVRPRVIAYVGSNVRYAYMHHEGTKPHPITAAPGRVLSFRVNGRRIVARRVMHPGTRPNRYLTDSLIYAVK